MGVVTTLAIGSKGNPIMFAPLHLRMALEAEGRDTVDKVVFKIRAVCFVAVVTALRCRIMIVPGIHYPCVAVQADKCIRGIWRVGIMAALAFRIPYRCVLVFGLDDIHVA